MNFHIQSPRQKQLAQPNLYSTFKDNNNLQYPNPKFSPAVFALPIVKSIYQLMFLATSPFTPHLNSFPIINRSPRFPSEAGISPPHLSHRPTKSNLNRK